MSQKIKERRFEKINSKGELVEIIEETLPGKREAFGKMLIRTENHNLYESGMHMTAGEKRYKEIKKQVKCICGLDHGDQDACICGLDHGDGCICDFNENEKKKKLEEERLRREREEKERKRRLELERKRLEEERLRKEMEQKRIEEENVLDCIIIF